uniref:DEK-C domain-containing protein n=1 Tax=Anopheles farauti TaxID=69004 RepID=A0A182QCU7_9DIPT
MSAKNAVDEEKKLLSKMAEEREGDKGSMKPATAAPEDGGTSKADSTGTGADKKPTVADAVAETKNQTKKPDEKNDDDYKSKPDGSSVTDGNSQPDGAAGRDNGNAEKPKVAATETAGKGRNGAKKPATPGEEDAEEGAGGGAGKKPTAGKSLGAIAQIDANINSAKVDDLQTLHTILYDGPAKAMVLRRNLRKFDGFEFGPDSDAYRKRVSATEKLDVKKLAQLAHVLALEKKGTKEELAARICTFLLKPDGEEELSADELGEEEEEDEDDEEEEEVSEEEEAPKKKTPARRGGAAAATPTRGRDNASSKSTSGRPKRTTAGRGYQDYTSSEEEEEETVKVGRGRRARRGSDSGSDYNPSAGSDSDAGKRRSSRAPARGSRTSARNVRKRYSDDESEESASDEDFSEDDRRKKKTTPARGGRGRPSAAAAASRQSQRGRGRKRKAETESEEEESEEEEVDSEDSDRPKRKSVAKTGGRVVAANNKAKNVTPVKGRGQPKRAAAVNSAKKTKRGRGRSSSGDEDDEEDEEDAEEEEEEDEPELEENESEDEKPLVKKAKQEKEVVDAAAPPSEDDIKEYLKEILEEANLEEITMKTVCKKVYAKYPEHDLSHKKDFIKATVKSLIST